MKYLYRVMWCDPGTRNPYPSTANIYKFVEAYSVTEAIQIAGYEYGVGVACNVPILEVRIVEYRRIDNDKELEDG